MFAVIREETRRLFRLAIDLGASVGSGPIVLNARIKTRASTCADVL